MIRIRQIAVASVGSAILAIGAVGCMQEQPEPVSPKAMMETSGDKVITWSAPSAGRLTIIDKNTNKIVYGSTVAGGQAVKVDVDVNHIMLDSQVVSENSLHGGDQYPHLLRTHYDG